MENYEVTTKINWLALARKLTDLIIAGGFTALLLFLVLVAIFRVKPRMVALVYSLVLTAIAYIIQLVANEHINVEHVFYLSYGEKIMTSFVPFVVIICMFLLSFALVIHVIIYIFRKIRTMM